jgi:hypothetical protein
MGFLSRLFGTESPRPTPPNAPPSERQALERYRYMLETAPPETIERAHEEAFAKLTPEQRRQVLRGLVETAPANESASLAQTPVDDTKALARAATRAEIRQPGVMERTLGGGMGMGASLLSSFAMGFVGSMVANSFFSAIGGFGNESGEAQADAAPADESAEGEADYGDDAGFDGGGDFDV